MSGLGGTIAREWADHPPCAGRVPVALLLLAVGGRLYAQTVSGIVMMPDSVHPAPGVIVVATGARGDTTARVLTNQAGRFTIRLPAAGRYGLTMLRIGYRPTQGPPVVIAAGESETVRLVLADRPVTLSSVNVRDRETCRVSADTGFMVTRVWDEARKAMLTTQLVGDETPLFAEWIEYDRVLDSTARLVRQQHVRTSRGPTTHAFRSRPAQYLDSAGYVVADSSGTTYFAPDADVLLSESFAAGHCFRLVGAPSYAPNLIGVGFQPSRDRRDKHDIEGTLWVDRASAELRTLEFRYTNLPDVIMAAQPGGVVQFLRLSDGHWLVSDWRLRMPRAEPRGRSSNNGLGRIVMAASNLVVRDIQIAGGEVNRVTRRDTLLYAAGGPSIALQVVSRDTLVPPAGARLTLEGTDYAGRADSLGLVKLSPVLAGRYRARVSIPLMDSLGMPAITGEVEARTGARIDSLELPSPNDVLFAACPRDSVRKGEGMLHGVVRDERARPMRGAAVTVVWQGNFEMVGLRDGSHLLYDQGSLGAVTGDAGNWRVCGVPRGPSLAVRVVTDSGSDIQRVRLDERRAFASVDLVTHAKTSAAAAEAEVATRGPAGAARAVVEISVMADGVELPGAQVEVAEGNQTRRLTTGSTGRVLLPGVAPGMLTVRVRRLGYVPGAVVARVDVGRNTIPIILARTALPTLDTVRVMGNTRLFGLGRNDEFETRRVNHLATVSITREDIRKRNPVDAWQMLTTVPSIRIIDSAGVTAESTRSNDMLPDGSQRKCYIRVMVDGLELMPRQGQNAVDLRQLPKPEEIHGIEVFAGPASIPVQYGGAGTDKWCGLIAIWTR